MDKSITTNIQAPPTRDDRPIGIKVISKKNWDEEKDDELEDKIEDEVDKYDELEETPVAFQPPYPGGKPGGVPEDVEDEEDALEFIGGSNAESLFFEQVPAPRRPGEPEDPNAAQGMDPNAPQGMDPNAPQGMGMDPNAPQGMGMDPNAMGGMGGMGGMDPTQTQLSDPGKGLELKKIFSRLLALQNFLSSAADQGLTVLKDYVSKAIELFRTVVDNLAVYRERIDDIIVLFYEFIEKTYAVMKEYYTRKDEKSKENNVTLKSTVESKVEAKISEFWSFSKKPEKSKGDYING